MRQVADCEMTNALVILSMQGAMAGYSNTSVFGNKIIKLFSGKSLAYTLYINMYIIQWTTRDIDCLSPVVFINNCVKFMQIACAFPFVKSIHYLIKKNHR